MRITRSILSLFVILFFAPMLKAQEISYLALGDSYTIGESVTEENRWPNLLQKALLEKDIHLQKPQIIARTGWTTSELLSAMDKANPEESYDLVSVLIGVNNQYRGQDTTRYRAELKTVLTRAVNLAGGRNDRVLVVSIPDYSVTPFVAGYGLDPQKISRELEYFNEIKRAMSKEMNLFYVCITDISLRAKEEASLLAGDGLHPSAEMYKEWVERLIPVTQKMLGE